ncbi:hypothetical protein RE428_17610 [Marinobacter nanhaiticus D15-8W]|uniref:STAS domain-containing protein n=1 Tax=Marinobacter nanhaiticus D15-8W TaxID=626887 RepID=N6WP93_9GAMM|nr:STAS domain-containing protein [Marinobacter nanhaiticus]ENO13376.1 STAS domain-containing protein [Marinobacter nanhaiticus D15-8W]BES70743.1 hypothetical protein RE428_17610 [Marinobacter nanhaiticus D15-8W]
MNAQAPALVEKDPEGCLKLSGTVLEPDVRAVRKEGERLLGEWGSGECTVDVAGLNNASSVVLSLMLCWKREAIRRNIELRFEGANERLRDLAEMSHVAGYLGLESA